MISVITPSIRPEFLNITQECLEKQTFQNFEWIVDIGLRNRGYTLPSSWNSLLRRCTYDRIFILQDCIDIPEDSLEKIVTLDIDHKMYTFPVGQVMEFGQTPEWDWRIEEKYIGKLTANLWETDLALAHKSGFYQVGGYDEEFNQGWSWENVEIAWRLESTGYSFFLSHMVKGISLKHDKLRENPFRNKRENNDKRAEETRRRASRGQYRLNYLS